MIHYRTTKGCDYGDRQVSDSVKDYVNARGGDGYLVKALVHKDLLTTRDVFDTYSGHDEWWLDSPEDET